MWLVLFCACAAVTILGKSKPLPGRVAGHFFTAVLVKVTISGQWGGLSSKLQILSRACFGNAGRRSVRTAGVWHSKSEIIWALNLNLQCSHCSVSDRRRRRREGSPDELVKNIQAKKKTQKQNVKINLNSSQWLHSVKASCLANQPGSLNQ